MMKSLILLAAICLSSAVAQGNSDDSGTPPPVEGQTPMAPPPPVMDQPPPPADNGNYRPESQPAQIPRRRMPIRSTLGDQERELLDKHLENAAHAKRGVGLKKASEANGAAKGSGKGAAKSAAAKSDAGMLNVDYVDEPILDVLRAIATAFKLSLIPDKDLGDVKVTIHLENIPVLEGLDKLCKSHGLELLADGNVYRVRKTRENVFSSIEVGNKRLNLDVQNRPVKDFLREFVEKTRINIVPGQGLKGTVTGHLKDVEAIDGFKALMAANDYDVRLKNGVYLVENGDSSGQSPTSFRHNPRGMGFPGGGAGNTEVDVHDGKVTLSLNNASLGDAIREIAEQAGQNFTIIGDVSGNVNAQLKDVTVDEALSALLQGTRYAFIKKDGTLLIGDRNPNTPSGQALSGAELVYLKFIKAENIEKVMPKSIPVDNIKVIKEQNAVLISGTVDDIELVKVFLEKVDIPTPQVLMEVIVVEYNRGKDSEFGIAPGKTAYSGVNALIQGSMSGVTETVKNGSFQASIGIKPPNFDLSLRALESKNRAKILSMPKITTLNGNKAELRVSNTFYYQVSSVTKDGFQNNDFRSIDDGITIELTPWVTKHGEVNVTISPSIKTAGQAPGGAPPPITNRSITTNVMLMDGETIALGGLISSKEDNRREFVPILGSIPLLGYLFSWRKALTITNELVIYVTPHILNPETQSVNLEEEFESLNRRSGFLDKKDFLKSSKPGLNKKEATREEARPAAKTDADNPKPAVLKHNLRD
jgi:type IV pilus assembly protein PilQ